MLCLDQLEEGLSTEVSSLPSYTGLGTYLSIMKPENPASWHPRAREYHSVMFDVSF